MITWWTRWWIMKIWRKKFCSFDITRDNACISIWCAATFIGLGTTLTIIGPTLLDLADSVGVGISELAAVLFCRSVGSVIGAGGSGFICDRFSRASIWMISIDVLVAAILTCALPLAPHVAVLGVIMFFHGFCLGALDTGVHALLMKVWRNKDTGPIMQFIHFTFAFGAFLAPLFSKPFISDSESVARNISCANIKGSGQMADIFVIVDCSSSASSMFFGYAYWISVIPLLIPLPPLLYYGFKQQCCCPVLFKRKQSLNVTAEDETSDENSTKYPSSKVYIVTVLSFLFLFMAVYVGMEVTFGTYIFAFAVKGSLQLSKQRAASLSSLFWGTFSFARCFSIVVSLFKAPPSLMMIGNLTGSLVAATIMLIWRDNEIGIWIGSGLLGASVSAIYPTTMVWMSQHVPPSGKAAGVLGTGAVLGDTLFPLLVGILLDKVDPIALVFYTFGAVVLCVFIISTMFIGTKFYLKKWNRENKLYQKLQTDQDEENVETVELTSYNEKEDEGQETELNAAVHSNKSEENGFNL